MVVIPGDLERRRSITTAVYGGTLVAVEGNYDDVNRLCSEVAGEPEDWGFVNVNLRPYYAEGSKTLGYEVAEQLGWRLPAAGRDPDRVGLAAHQGRQGVPGAGRSAWSSDRRTRIFGAQATGCSPVAQAFSAGQDVVRPVKPGHDRQVAGDRQPGRRPVRARRRPAAPAGRSRTSPTSEVVEGIRLLPETEGIFAETAGGVTVATLRKLLASGALDPEAETVILNTGDGLKTLDAVAPGGRARGHHRPSTRPSRRRPR